MIRRNTIDIRFIPERIFYGILIVILSVEFPLLVRAIIYVPTGTICCSVIVSTVEKEISIAVEIIIVLRRFHVVYVEIAVRGLDVVLFVGVLFVPFEW